MVSVTMVDNPPPAVPDYNQNSGIVIFQVSPGGSLSTAQVDAYYEKNFRIKQMETFARMVLEKGHGTMAPARYVSGRQVRETWQAVGRRLFGQRFVPVMERLVQEYRAAQAVAPPEPVPEPPPAWLTDIPDPDF